MTLGSPSDSKMSDAMNQVFLIPELVETILEFAASGEPWKETRNLRLVCKSWRDLSIKGLCASSWLPEVDIGSIRSIESFRRKYPHNTSLPIHVKVDGFNSQIYESLAEFAPIIAELDLTTERQYTTDEMNGELQFNMAILRKLTVYHNLTLESHHFASFLDKVVENAGRMSFFEMYNPIPGMRLPKKLTHMRICASVSELKDLLCLNEVPLLIGMEITFKPEMPVTSRIVNFEGFNLAAAMLFPNLELLDISLPYDVSGGPMILPPLDKLKHFSTDLSVEVVDGSQFCNNRALRSVEFRLTDTGLKDLDLFVAPGAIYENLKSVSLWNPQSGSVGDNNVLRSIQENRLPSCPGLESVKMFGFSDAVLVELMPAVYSEWRTIKSLKVGVKLSNNNGSVHDLVTLLTGLRRNEVPRQEQLWRECLQGRTNAITNLISLEKLSISVRRRGKYVELDRFVFNAAFLTMENLKSIKLGDIQLDQNIAKEWKAAGREIETYEFLF